MVLKHTRTYSNVNVVIGVKSSYGPRVTIHEHENFNVQRLTLLSVIVLR